MKLILVAALLLVSCSQAKPAVVAAAEATNIVAEATNEASAGLVKACDAAERAAVEHPDVAEAERLILQIRKECDRAFAATKAVGVAVSSADRVARLLSIGKASPEELWAAVRDAQVALEELRVSVESMEVTRGK